MTRPTSLPKREHNGQYAFDGRLERLCVCGHPLGNHCAGSPADCLVYSMPERERMGIPNGGKPECGCQKFRQSRKGQSVEHLKIQEEYHTICSRLNHLESVVGNISMMAIYVSNRQMTEHEFLLNVKRALRNDITGGTQ